MTRPAQPGARKGRAPGSGAAQARILAALRATGHDKAGIPVPLRSADLAARAKVGHSALYKATTPLIELGQISACMVQPAKGPKTYEYRISVAGTPVAPSAPLKPAKVGAATASHRSHREPPPVPVLKQQAEVTPTRTRAPIGGMPGRDELDRVQRMSEAEFGDYVMHLARMWAFGRGKRVVA